MARSIDDVGYKNTGALQYALNVRLHQKETNKIPPTVGCHKCTEAGAWRNNRQRCTAGVDVQTRSIHRVYGSCERDTDGTLS